MNYSRMSNFLKAKCFTVHFKSVCLSFCELKRFGVQTCHIRFLTFHSKQLLEGLMWHIHRDRQSDTNTDTCPGARALAGQTQRQVWWPPSLSDQRPPARQRLPSQQSTALQPCCTETPSLVPASYHEVRVTFAGCMHRKYVSCKGSSKISFWSSAFYAPTCLAATARRLMVSAFHVILHKYSPPTEWYVKAGLHFSLYFLVSCNFSLAWTGITINHQISKGVFGWLVFLF